MQCKEETAERKTQRKNVHAETLHADETPPLKDFEQKNERADHLQEPAKDDSNGEAPIWEHIGELRQRLLKCVAAVVVCFACLMYVGPQRIMDLVTAPVKKEGVQFIYLGLADVLYVQMKVVFLCAVILASPVLLWQLWAFVRPALYPEEKKLALGWTFLSLFLFVLGVTFGYVAVFSSALSFFVYVGVDTALPLLALDRYVSFLIGFVLPFGIIFEMPLACSILAKAGVLHSVTLKKGRRFAILLSFVIGALLTPPDVISQIMMALPAVLLFEISIACVKWQERSRARELSL